MSAVPTSPLDSFDAQEAPIEAPATDFLRAVVPNHKDDNLLGESSKQEVKQGLGRVIAKIHAYRDQTKQRKIVEKYQKVSALGSETEQLFGKNLDRQV